MAKDKQREAILDGLADGKSLRTICKAKGMPHIATVMRWCSEDRDWSEQYARARAAGDEAMAEDIQEISDRDGLDPQDKKVRIDARKWLLAKRQPKKYGDATMIKHADADGEKIALDETAKFTRLAAIVDQVRKANDEPPVDAG